MLCAAPQHRTILKVQEAQRGGQWPIHLNVLSHLNERTPGRWIQPKTIVLWCVNWPTDVMGCFPSPIPTAGEPMIYTKHTCSQFLTPMPTGRGHMGAWGLQGFPGFGIYILVHQRESRKVSAESLCHTGLHNLCGMCVQIICKERCVYIGKHVLEVKGRSPRDRCLQTGSTRQEARDTYLPGWPWYTVCLTMAVYLPIESNAHEEIVRNFRRRNSGEEIRKRWTAGLKVESGTLFTSKEQRTGLIFLELQRDALASFIWEDKPPLGLVLWKLSLRFLVEKCSEEVSGWAVPY